MTLKESLEVREITRKIALLNALHHKGKAQTQSVLSRLLAELPHLKPKVKEVASLVAEVVQEVNRLSLPEQRDIVERRWPEALRREKAEEKKKLPPLPKAEKYAKIVTRFAPNPDCALHLGSARAIILSHDYAREYNGLFYLRFEDTDPRLKKSALQFYDSIQEDLIWLDCKPDAEFIQSDRLPIYYEHAERLLKDDYAYVCSCKRREFREKVKKKHPCSCRNLSPKENINRWRRMLNGTYGVGKAVVRIKTDLKHPNPAVREWPAFRIINPKKHPHPRVGSRYRVWPLYNFACGIDDHLMGVTHIIRGKEHLTNQIRQEYMYRHFGWEYPETIHYGRLKIAGASLSKSKILQGLRSDLYKHWDDPRLATFAALRKRAISPAAIRRLMIDVGPKAADVVLSWENLYAHNRKIIDSVANRYFFVCDPLRLTVKGLPRAFTVRIPLHPDYPNRGFRCFEIKSKGGEASFLISGGDEALITKGEKIRLMGLFNFQVEDVEKHRIKAVFHSEPYEEARKLGIPLIHWVPEEKNVKVKVVMPTAEIVGGVGERDLKNEEVDKVVQLIRFGFGRINRLENDTVEICYAHN